MVAANGRQEQMRAELFGRYRAESGLVVLAVSFVGPGPKATSLRAVPPVRKRKADLD
jgi:hypothetical protein